MTFGNLRFLEDVLNEITTFDPFKAPSREAKCDSSASLIYVLVLWHLQTALGRHIGAKVVILEVAGGSLEGPPLTLFRFLTSSLRSFSRFEHALANLSFFDDVLNEIITFVPFWRLFRVTAGPSNS